MINAMKDAVTSRAVQALINGRISNYGSVQDLTIDSTRKRVEITCQLLGEPTPIDVKVGKYVVETVGDRKFVKITEVTCSRPWLQNLLVDFAQNRPVELPSWAAAAL
jgi:hypothetical protein